jgi:hypothetical protein
MPVKKTKKPRARKAPAKKKGLKQKQKQKQQQKVNVQVSTGGGGGGTQFIPMPSAPAFDYAQLAQLIRPAATVDVPIRAQANPEPLPAREAEEPSLMEELPSAKGRKVRSDYGGLHKSKSKASKGYFDETESGPESEANVRATFERVKASGSKSKASKAKPFIASPSPSDFNIFSDEPIQFPSSRSGSGPTRDLFGSGPSFSSGSD